MDRLSLFVRDGGGRVFVEVEGAVDVATYAEFQMKLHSLMRRSDVIVDMSRVRCLSSSGLGAIIAAMEGGSEWGTRLFLLKPSAIVRLAIEASGFGYLFPVIEVPEDAD